MKYRLFPTKAQTTVLEQTLEACRWVYNKTEYRKFKRPFPLTASVPLVPPAALPLVRSPRASLYPLAPPDASPTPRRPHAG